MRDRNVILLVSSSLLIAISICFFFQAPQHISVVLTVTIDWGDLEPGMSYNKTVPYHLTRTFNWEYDASFDLRDYVLVSFVPVKGGTRIHLHVREEIKEFLTESLEFKFRMR